MWLQKKDGVYCGKKNFLNICRKNIFDKTANNTIISLEKNEDNIMLSNINMRVWKKSLFTVCNLSNAERTINYRRDLEYHEQAIMFNPETDYYNPIDRELNLKDDEIKEMARIIILSNFYSYDIAPSLLEMRAIDWLYQIITFKREENYDMYDIFNFIKEIRSATPEKINELIVTGENELEQKKKLAQDIVYCTDSKFFGSIISILLHSLKCFGTKVGKENVFSVEKSYYTKYAFGKNKAFYFITEDEDMELYRTIINLLIFDFIRNNETDEKMLFILNNKKCSDENRMFLIPLLDKMETFGEKEANKFLITQDKLNDNEDHYTFFRQILKYNKETKKIEYIQKLDKYVKITEIEI
jgi:hypothetical protein